MEAGNVESIPNSLPLFFLSLLHPVNISPLYQTSPPLSWTDAINIREKVGNNNTTITGEGERETTATTK